MAQAPPAINDAALADIQGFLTSGYGHLAETAYLFVRIADASAARRWIDRLIPEITTSSRWPKSATTGRAIKPASAINIAFTAAGLAACGVPSSVLCTFAPEFREGIATPERSQILGDRDDSDPARWEIGGPATAPIHAIVIVHADSEATLDKVCAAQRARFAESGGVIEIAGSVQRGHRPSTDREPFGFHDGIAQPAIRGFGPDAGVPTGEFILGYLNHYGLIPPAPVVPLALDPGDVLPIFENDYHVGEGLRDLGRNGSYVVYRKLQQDVAAFWRFMRSEAARLGHDDAEYIVWLASKCVGRWPSGAPLALAPERDDPAIGKRDAFLYAPDPDGLRCPLGAHVRRSNPRDVLKPYEVPQSQHMTEAHRLLRRGRAYGPPLFDAALLEGPSSSVARAMLASIEDDGVARGIHFVCVNASIRSQFEFVQQTWCNNPRFGGLNDNKDPIIGDHRLDDESPSVMTIPGSKSSLRTSALPRFVTVRGGAYFFMPSLTALQFLAAMGG